MSVSPLESMQSGGAIPPPLKRGISAILARYPMKIRQMGAIPPSAILSRKGIARYGGVSRTGPLSPGLIFGTLLGSGLPGRKWAAAMLGLPTSFSLKEPPQNLFLLKVSYKGTLTPRTLSY